jgi:hypothetical protein
LGIGNFLREYGWDEEKIALATTHIISRAVYPASELKTVSYIKENPAITEITPIDHEQPVIIKTIIQTAHKFIPDTSDISD